MLKRTKYIKIYVHLKIRQKNSSVISVFFFFLSFVVVVIVVVVVVAISWAAPVAYGGSQARG